MQLILQKRKQWTTTVTCGVENHCQAFFLSIWVNVEPSIDALKSKNGTLRMWPWLTLFWKCWHADWIMGDTRNNCEYIPRGMLRIYFETKRLQVKSLYKFPIELRCFFWFIIKPTKKSNFWLFFIPFDTHLHIWPPHMDQVSSKHLAVFLVEAHPGSDHLPGKKHSNLREQTDLHLVAGLSKTRCPL